MVFIITLKRGKSMYRRSALLALLALGGCSIVETSGGGAADSTMLSAERIQLEVRTGDDQMNAVVYELAFEQFSKVSPLREAESYTATLEVTFVSLTQSGFIGSSTTAANTRANSSS